MRIKVGDTSKKIYFIAVDSTDGFTRETGISSWTVYYSLNGGTATAMTTPTVTELSATNMPGVYVLDVDESGMVASAGELVVHVTASGVAPITRIVEIVDNFEKDIYDIVNNATYGNSALNSDLDAIKAKTDQLTFTVTNKVDANVTHVAGTSQTARDLGANIDTTISSRAPASTALSNTVWTDTKAGYLDASISSRGSATDVSAIKAKTDQLTFTTANRVDATAVAVSDKTGYSLASDQSSVTIGTVNALGTQAKADVEAECGDALNTAFDDSTSLTTNGLKDRIRTLTWILRNKLVMTKATGDGVLYKDDSITQAFSVSGLVLDDSTYVTRKRLQ